MKMTMVRTIMSLAAAAMLVNIAAAATYTVGGPNGGWDQSTNLQAWASSQSFVVGDSLVFQYSSNHDVLEVTKSDFDSCSTSNPIQTYTDGNTAINLASSGERYFICGSAGHCGQGMNVKIDTLATAAPPPAATTPTPPSAAPSTPPPSPASPVTPPASSPTPEDISPASPVTPPASPEDISPSASPAAIVDSPTESPANAPSSGVIPPPAPSSATKFNIMMGLSFVIMMIPTL